MIGTLLQLDTKLFYFFNARLANHVFDVVMPVITDLQNWIIPLIIMGLGLVIAGGKKARMTLIIALLVVGQTDLLCGKVLKPLVHRPRPSYVLTDARLLVGKGGVEGFPSNHAANTMALMTVFAYFYRRFAYGFLAIAALISFSRIYVGVHYPLDVLAGAIIGALISCLWIYVINYAINRISLKNHVNNQG